MKPLLKSLLLTTPTLLLTPALLAETATPTTQPATQPAPALAQSNDPLVIPDGTTSQNPGPYGPLLKTGGSFMEINGVRQ